VSVHATHPALACPRWCTEEHTETDRTQWSAAAALKSADPARTVGTFLLQDPGGRPVVVSDVQHDELTVDGVWAYARALLELVIRLDGGR
jgi:hypothetical protein